MTKIEIPQLLPALPLQLNSSNQAEELILSPLDIRVLGS